ncbi:hypothetical protein P3T76_011612 [Phytophthora citrophthora]|uniref:Uncharacterized protein n=1 Tax=Phytophthora citrophthora TaxID=4793 RepID=A0AAD9G8L9_9STRA|nr:hypothetical protein P3T76_011612 [Phytophthora citrophthora]
MTKLSATGSLLKTILRVFDPLIVYDAYTFRWLGFDPHEHDNTREQAFTKVTNVGLISELVFTVWVSWLDVVASTSFDNYGTSWSEEIKGVASSFLCTGMFFFLFSVINSVLVLLAVNETEDDHQATRLLQRLDLWFTIPSIYFYLGVEVRALQHRSRFRYHCTECSLLPVPHPLRLRHPRRSQPEDSFPSNVAQVSTSEVERQRVTSKTD